MDKQFTKLFNIDIKSVDEENRRITFCFSDDQEDRQGDIVDQGSWDVKNYMKNPLILWGHDPSKPEYVLGQGVELDLNNGGKSYITAQFDDDSINPTAGMIFRQLVKRTLRTVSAGFITHTYEYDNDTPVLKDNELLEVSIVPIPANPRALAKDYKAGNISTKDAKFLLESMAAETKALSELIAARPKSKKEKSMTDEQAAAMIEGMGKMTEKLDAVVEDNKALREDNKAMREEIAALKPAEETAEEKAAREQKEADDKAVAEKAEADKKAADEEAARKAEEDAKAKEDLAKSGEHDQDRAGKIDDDTELTPEQEEALRKELEAALV